MGLKINKSVQSKKDSSPKRSTRNKISDRTKDGFFNQLSVLLTSGLDLKNALLLLAEETTKDNYIINIYNEIVSGSTFSNALVKNGFGEYDYYTILIGEETGTIINSLEELHHYYSTKIEQKKQLISSLTYPIIILAVAFSAVAFMLVFMVPMFKDVFKKFNKDLPWITQQIITLSDLIKVYGGFVFLLLIAIVFFIYVNRNKAWWKKLFGFFILRVPIVGKLYLQIQLAIFCRTVSVMQKSKIPLVKSFELAKNLIDFYPLHITYAPIIADVTKGMPIYKAFEKHSIYSSKMILMIKVGEQTNNLDTFFNQLANQFQSDANTTISVLSTILEPLLIIFLGIVVGLILVAMYMPMFELGSLF